MNGDAQLAVALHDVEPATYERCVEIREWLAERGVSRVTLLVIPAVDLHPFASRRPDMADWLRARRAAGDEVAQHGLIHRQTRRAWPGRQALARVEGGRAAEFAGLGADDAQAAIETGRRILDAAGLDARGFVAPAYAYTRALRQALAGRFDWWAGLMRVSVSCAQACPVVAPAVGLGTSGPVKRTLSPHTARIGARIAGRVLRLDLHPVDFDDVRRRATLERVLDGARRRTPTTYSGLVAR